LRERGKCQVHQEIASGKMKIDELSVDELSVDKKLVDELSVDGLSPHPSKQPNL
jgi:hypothetical protein